MPVLNVNPWNNDIVFDYEHVAYKDEKWFGDEIQYFDDMIVTQLLLARKVHLNDLPTEHGSKGRTVALYVDCSDIFAWGSGDSESVAWGESQGTELAELYEEWYADNKWGVIRWCIKKRGEKPTSSIRAEMLEDDAWYNMPEDLINNKYEGCMKILGFSLESVVNA